MVPAAAARARASLNRASASARSPAEQQQLSGGREAAGAEPVVVPGQGQHGTEPLDALASSAARPARTGPSRRTAAGRVRVAGRHRAVERRAGRCRGRRSAPAAPPDGRCGRCRAPSASARAANQRRWRAAASASPAAPARARPSSRTDSSIDQRSATVRVRTQQRRADQPAQRGRHRARPRPAGPRRPLRRRRA